MKNIKTFRLFESAGLSEDQIEFLNMFVKGTWTLNLSTGLVDVDGNVDCISKKLKNFSRIQFGRVSGVFSCYNNKLSSLAGAPKEVGGGFYCYNNKLSSLAGAPEKVGMDFDCNNNVLTSLEGAPKKVGGKFNCRNNKLSSLEGAPKDIGSYFSCDGFELRKGEWNLEGWLKVFLTGTQKAKDLVLTIIGPEKLNREIQKDPEEMMMNLKGVWNSPDFASIRKGIKIPDRYKEEMETLADLSDLGF
jgi:hypothetical protein